MDSEVTSSDGNEGNVAETEREIAEEVIVKTLKKDNSKDFETATASFFNLSTWNSAESERSSLGDEEDTQDPYESLITILAIDSPKEVFHYEEERDDLEIADEPLIERVQHGGLDASPPPTLPSDSSSSTDSSPTTKSPDQDIEPPSLYCEVRVPRFRSVSVLTVEAEIPEEKPRVIAAEFSSSELPLIKDTADEGTTLNTEGTTSTNEISVFTSYVTSPQVETAQLIYSPRARYRSETNLSINDTADEEEKSEGTEGTGTTNEISVFTSYVTSPEVETAQLIYSPRARYRSETKFSVESDGTVELVQQSPGENVTLTDSQYSNIVAAANKIVKSAIVSATEALQTTGVSASDTTTTLVEDDNNNVELWNVQTSYERSQSFELKDIDEAELGEREHITDVNEHRSLEKKTSLTMESEVVKDDDLKDVKDSDVKVGSNVKDSDVKGDDLKDSDVTDSDVDSDITDSDVTDSDVKKGSGQYVVNSNSDEESTDEDDKKEGDQKDSDSMSDSVRSNVDSDEDQDILDEDEIPQTGSRRVSFGMLEVIDENARPEFNPTSLTESLYETSTIQEESTHQEAYGNEDGEELPCILVDELEVTKAKERRRRSDGSVDRKSFEIVRSAERDDVEEDQEEWDYVAKETVSVQEIMPVETVPDEENAPVQSSFSLSKSIDTEEAKPKKKSRRISFGLRPQVIGASVAQAESPDPEHTTEQSEENKADEENEEKATYANEDEEELPHILVDELERTKAKERKKKKPIVRKISAFEIVGADGLFSQPTVLEETVTTHEESIQVESAAPPQIVTQDEASKPAKRSRKISFGIMKQVIGESAGPPEPCTPIPDGNESTEQEAHKNKDHEELPHIVVDELERTKAKKRKKPIMRKNSAFEMVHSDGSLSQPDDEEDTVTIHEEESSYFDHESEAAKPPQIVTKDEASKQAKRSRKISFGIMKQVIPVSEPEPETPTLSQPDSDISKAREDNEHEAYENEEHEELPHIIVDELERTKAKERKKPIMRKTSSFEMVHSDGSLSQPDVEEDPVRKQEEESSSDDQESEAGKPPQIVTDEVGKSAKRSRKISFGIMKQVIPVSEPEPETPTQSQPDSYKSETREDNEHEAYENEEHEELPHIIVDELESTKAKERKKPIHRKTSAFEMVHPDGHESESDNESDKPPQIITDSTTDEVKSTKRSRKISFGIRKQVIGTSAGQSEPETPTLSQPDSDLSIKSSEKEAYENEEHEELPHILVDELESTKAKERKKPIKRKTSAFEMVHSDGSMSHPEDSEESESDQSLPVVISSVQADGGKPAKRSRKISFGIMKQVIPVSEPEPETPTRSQPHLDFSLQQENKEHEAYENEEHEELPHILVDELESTKAKERKKPMVKQDSAFDIFFETEQSTKIFDKKDDLQDSGSTLHDDTEKEKKRSRKISFGIRKEVIGVSAGPAEPSTSIPLANELEEAYENKEHELLPHILVDELEKTKAKEIKLEIPLVKQNSAFEIVLDTELEQMVAQKPETKEEEVVEVEETVSVVHQTVSYQSPPSHDNTHDADGMKDKNQVEEEIIEEVVSVAHHSVSFQSAPAAHDEDLEDTAPREERLLTLNCEYTDEDMEMYLDEETAESSEKNNNGTNDNSNQDDEDSNQNNDGEIAEDEDEMENVRQLASELVEQALTEAALQMVNELTSSPSVLNRESNVELDKNQKNESEEKAMDHIVLHGEAQGSDNVRRVANDTVEQAMTGAVLQIAEANGIDVAMLKQDVVVDEHKDDDSDHDYVELLPSPTTTTRRHPLEPDTIETERQSVASGIVDAAVFGAIREYSGNDSVLPPIPPGRKNSSSEQSLSGEEEGSEGSYTHLTNTNSERDSDDDGEEGGYTRLQNPTKDETSIEYRQTTHPMFSLEPLSYESEEEEEDEDPVISSIQERLKARQKREEKNDPEEDIAVSAIQTRLQARQRREEENDPEEDIAVSAIQTRLQARQRSEEDNKQQEEEEDIAVSAIQTRLQSRQRREEEKEHMEEEDIAVSAIQTRLQSRQRREEEKEQEEDIAISAIQTRLYARQRREEENEQEEDIEVSTVQEILKARRTSEEDKEQQEEKDFAVSDFHTRLQARVDADESRKKERKKQKIAPAEEKRLKDKDRQGSGIYDTYIEQMMTERDTLEESQDPAILAIQQRLKARQGSGAYETHIARLDLEQFHPVSSEASLLDVKPGAQESTSEFDFCKESQSETDKDYEILLERNISVSSEPRDYEALQRSRQSSSCSESEQQGETRHRLKKRLDRIDSGGSNKQEQEEVEDSNTKHKEKERKKKAKVRGRVPKSGSSSNEPDYEADESSESEPNEDADTVSMDHRHGDFTTNNDPSIVYSQEEEEQFRTMASLIVSQAMQGAVEYLKNYSQEEEMTEDDDEDSEEDEDEPKGPLETFRKASFLANAMNAFKRLSSGNSMEEKEEKEKKRKPTDDDEVEEEDTVDEMKSPVSSFLSRSLSKIRSQISGDSDNEEPESDEEEENSDDEVEEYDDYDEPPPQEIIDAASVIVNEATENALKEYKIELKGESKKESPGSPTILQRMKSSFDSMFSSHDDEESEEAKTKSKDTEKKSKDKESPSILESMRLNFDRMNSRESDKNKNKATIELKEEVHLESTNVSQTHNPPPLVKQNTMRDKPENKDQDKITEEKISQTQNRPPFVMQEAIRQNSRENITENIESSSVSQSHNPPTLVMRNNSNDNEQKNTEETIEPLTSVSQSHHNPPPLVKLDLEGLQDPSNQVKLANEEKEAVLDEADPKLLQSPTLKSVPSDFSLVLNTELGATKYTDSEEEDLGKVILQTSSLESSPNQTTPIPTSKKPTNRPTTGYISPASTSPKTVRRLSTTRRGSAVEDDPRLLSKPREVLRVLSLETEHTDDAYPVPVEEEVLREKQLTVKRNEFVRQLTREEDVDENRKSEVVGDDERRNSDVFGKEEEDGKNSVDGGRKKDGSVDRKGSIEEEVMMSWSIGEPDATNSQPQKAAKNLQAPKVPSVRHLHRSISDEGGDDTDDMADFSTDFDDYNPRPVSHRRSEPAFKYDKKDLVYQRSKSEDPRNISEKSLQKQFEWDLIVEGSGFEFTGSDPDTGNVHETSPNQIESDSIAWESAQSLGNAPPSIDPLDPEAKRLIDEFNAAQLQPASIPVVDIKDPDIRKSAGVHTFGPKRKTSKDYIPLTAEVKSHSSDSESEGLVEKIKSIFNPSKVKEGATPQSSTAQTDESELRKRKDGNVTMLTMKTSVDNIGVVDTKAETANKRQTSVENTAPVHTKAETAADKGPTTESSAPNKSPSILETMKSSFDSMFSREDNEEKTGEDEKSKSKNKSKDERKDKSKDMSKDKNKAKDNGDSKDANKANGEKSRKADGKETDTKVSMGNLVSGDSKEDTLDGDTNQQSVQEVSVGERIKAKAQAMFKIAPKETKEAKKDTRKGDEKEKRSEQTKQEPDKTTDDDRRNSVSSTASYDEENSAFGRLKERAQEAFRQSPFQSKSNDSLPQDEEVKAKTTTALYSARPAGEGRMQSRDISQISSENESDQDIYGTARCNSIDVGDNEKDERTHSEKLQKGISQTSSDENEESDQDIYGSARCYSIANIGDNVDITSLQINSEDLNVVTTTHTTDDSLSNTSSPRSRKDTPTDSEEYFTTLEYASDGKEEVKLKRSNAIKRKSSHDESDVSTATFSNEPPQNVLRRSNATRIKKPKMDDSGNEAQNAPHYYYVESKDLPGVPLYQSGYIADEYIPWYRRVADSASTYLTWKAYDADEEEETVDGTDSTNKQSPTARNKSALNQPEDEIDHAVQSSSTSSPPPSLSQQLVTQTFAHQPRSTLASSAGGGTMAVRGWINRGEEIIRSEVGQDEFNRRLEKQKLLFKKGCQKGGFMDYFSISGSKGTLKKHFEGITKKEKRRGSHSAGVGAMGYAIFKADERIPENDFFRSGVVREVRARHSNSPNSDDDRRIGQRSLSLKFEDHDKESPLDLILQTGNISGMFNAEAVEERMLAFSKGGEAVKRHLLSLPIHLQAAIEGVRKRPDSYYHQHYYSQMTYDFSAEDEVRRLCRFRVVPADGRLLESGRLTPQEQREAWYHMLLDKPEPDLEPNYLKQEFRDRVRDIDTVYNLEIQLHEWEEDDNNNLYNPALAWDESDHPWLSVASIHLNSVLPDDVIELTRFSIARCPKEVLSWPEGTSVFDFNIVPTFRKELYELLQRQRPSDPEPPPRDQATEYLVHTVTGEHKDAGIGDAKCDVFISIIGVNGRTPYRKLERKLKSDFSAGAKPTFSVFDKAVGEFLCAKVYKIAKGKKSDWLLDYIILTTPYNNKCYTLPCYRWFTDETTIMTLREGNAATTTNELQPYLQLQRSMEIASKQQLYRWYVPEDPEDNPFAGLPGYCEASTDLTKLPRDLKFDNERAFDLEWSKHVKSAGSFMDTLMAMFKSRKGKIDLEYETLLTDLVGKERSDNLNYIVKNWRKDEEFGRQLLNTLAPLKLCELREIPDNFPVTDEMMRGVLPADRSLEDEVDDGRIFLISYPELEEFAKYEVVGDPFSDTASIRSVGFDEESVLSYDIENAPESYNAETASIASVETFDGDLEGNDTNANDVANGGKKNKKDKKKKEKKPKEPKPKKEKPPKEPKPSKEQKKYLCAPQVLLYNNGEAIVPIAIQLTQEAANPPLIYTPRDDNGEYSDWLIAKMWVRVAEANVHQFSVHVLGSHLILEPIAIAGLRNLPSAHPVFKLLQPHLRHIVAANTLYRRHVIPTGGALAECMALGQEPGAHIDFLKQQYYSFKIGLLYLPDNFAERGVLDEELVPGYPYRDDCLRIWSMTQDFVSDIVSIFYEDDEAVEKDEELNNMLTDMRMNGFHPRADIKDKFASVEDLVKFLTIVIFRCSAHHALTNNVMLDTYAFIPNAPPCMMKPPPTSKRGAKGWSEAHLRAMLPSPELAARYIATIKLMCKDNDEERVLGQYPDQLFGDERAHVAVKTFQRRLSDLSKDMEQRGQLAEADVQNAENDEDKKAEPIYKYDYLRPELIQAHVSS